MKFIFTPHTYLNRSLRILLATNALILMSAAMLGPIQALFVTEIGGDLLDASFAAATFAVVAGITTLLIGRWTDRVKENELIIVAGYTLIGIAFFLFLTVETVADLLFVQILLGLGEAIYSPAFDAVYTRHLTDGKTGSGWGAWEAMNYFMITAGATVGGFIASRYGFDPLFIIMGTLSISAAAYIYFLPRRVL
ncbi:MFS transporter [Candidatus Kaiserbacteria bacterium]|nr:MFS transporter [Candidatus Kaiserbacteria bacterium]USN88427.1 MAG: MFS transporter [Candidatus Nomurabacteria bacterium]